MADAEGMEFDELHPFMNPVVLPALFQHCSLKDLTSCRLVCKQWHNSSLEAWRSTVVVVLRRKKRERMVQSSEEQSRQYPPLESHLEIEAEMPEFYNYLNNSTPEQESLSKLKFRPFSRYQVIRGFSTDIEGSFWNMMGGWMQELNLNGCTCISPGTWKTILFEKTPNLKKLILDGKVPSSLRIKYSNIPPDVETDSTPCEISGPQNNLTKLDIRNASWLYDFPMPWKEFFAAVPNLKEIILPFRHPSTQEPFLTGIKEVKSANARILPITSLDVISLETSPIMDFPDTTINLMEELQLPLKTFKVDIGYDSDESDIFILINLYVDTVETLMILKGCHKSASLTLFYPFIQSMNALTKLELVGPVVCNMGFLRYTPNLEVLIISKKYRSDVKRKERDEIVSTAKSAREMVDAAEDLNVEGNVMLLRMRELQVYFKLKGSSSVKLLAGWMPNLEVLRAPVSGKAFVEICHVWKETLQELILAQESDNIGDEVVTGLPKAWGTPLVSETFERPTNITALRNLRVFRTERYPCFERSSCFHDPPKLTDFSVLHGFMELPRLQSLHIGMANEMGAYFLRVLERRRVNVSISLKSCDAKSACMGLKILGSNSKSLEGKLRINKTLY